MRSKATACCLIGMEACVGAHHLSRRLSVVRAQRGFRDIHKREETLVNSLRWPVDLRAAAHAALIAWMASR
jgi:hypothetical protein